jgi:site-specific recombinase XerD
MPTAKRLSSTRCYPHGRHRFGGSHGARRPYGYHLLQSGTDLRTIQVLLGHRSFSTTARYVHVATASLPSIKSPFDRLDLTPQGGHRS